MIKNRVYKLKNAATIAKDIQLPAGQELEIVMDVVYVDGNLVPPSFQGLFLSWILNNPELFNDVTKNW